MSTRRRAERGAPAFAKRTAKVKGNAAHRELFVLGLVRRGPHSAYAIDRAMREHVPLYRRFSHGNTYQFVERLAKNGILSRQTAAARRGPHEQKWVYRLAPAGEARFQQLLQEIVTDVQASDVALETALVLLGQIPRSRALQLVSDRAAHVERYERRTKRLYGVDGRAPEGAGAFTRLRIVHRLQGERRYLNEIAGLLADPAWEPDWISDDGPVVDSSRKI